MPRNHPPNVMYEGPRGQAQGQLAVIEAGNSSVPDPIVGSRPGISGFQMLNDRSLRGPNDVIIEASDEESYGSGSYSMNVGEWAERVEDSSDNQWNQEMEMAVQEQEGEYVRFDN